MVGSLVARRIARGSVEVDKLLRDFPARSAHTHTQDTRYKEAGALLEIKIKKLCDYFADVGVEHVSADSFGVVAVHVHIESSVTVCGPSDPCVL